VTKTFSLVFRKGSAAAPPPLFYLFPALRRFYLVDPIDQNFFHPVSDVHPLDFFYFPPFAFYFIFFFAKTPRKLFFPLLPFFFFSFFCLKLVLFAVVDCPLGSAFL